MYKHFFKHVLDFILALLGFVALLPIFVVVCILLAIANNGKVFFLQARPGKNERIFNIIKFKTMNDRKDRAGNLLPAVERITKIGNIVRKTSVDEIPQLLNVIKGDMSLIGPRPLRVEYLPLYNAEQKTRHNIRPGITGWAQVNGRNTISWEERFKLDVWYVNNVSIRLDAKVFILTIKKVLVRENINQSNNITVEPFKGIKLKS